MATIDDVDVSRLAAALNGARRARLGMPVAAFLLAVPSLFAVNADVDSWLSAVAWSVIAFTAVIAVTLAVCDPANIRGRPAVTRLLKGYIAFAAAVSILYVVRAGFIMVPLFQAGLSVSDPMDEAGAFAVLGGMSSIIVLMLAFQLAKVLSLPLEAHDRAVLASARLSLPTLRMGFRKVMTSVIAATVGFGSLVIIAIIHRIPYERAWTGLQELSFGEVWAEFVTGWSRAETAVVAMTLIFVIVLAVLLEKLLELLAPRYAPLNAMWRWAKDARSALVFDRRPPVLLLRSFSDDAVSEGERAKDEYFATNVEGAVVSAVAAYGPFIAIGAPGEPVPAGAAYRIYLKDDEWQSSVLEWIRESCLIVACVGTTRWVRWELDNIQRLEQFGKTLLLMPPSDARSLAARWALLDIALSGTPWSAACAALADRSGVLLLMLENGGAVRVVRSGGTGRDDYHAAAVWALYRRLPR